MDKINFRPTKRGSRISDFIKEKRIGNVLQVILASFYPNNVFIL
jgi:hypothetical protein